MTTAITDSTTEPFVNPSELNASQLPPDLKKLSEQTYLDSNVHSYFFKDCNPRPYLIQTALKQENIRDDKLNEMNGQLRKLRGNLSDISTFLDKVNTELKTNPSAKEVHLTGDNELMNRLYEIFPDERLKKSKLSRTDAELLCHALTRKSDQQITPDIQELTTDMTHVIEDLDKILPILKKLLEDYDRLIERINNKPK